MSRLGLGGNSKPVLLDVKEFFGSLDDLFLLLRVLLHIQDPSLEIGQFLLLVLFFPFHGILFVGYLLHDSLVLLESGKTFLVFDFDNLLESEQLLVAVVGNEVLARHPLIASVAGDVDPLTVDS